MSLSKLNDQLHADICSFLDFKDINKLAQVNKGIKASLQRRSLDKPKVYRLYFEEQFCSDKMGCFVVFHSEDDMHQRIAEIELDGNVVTNSTEVLHWINKFGTMEYLVMRYIHLQDNAGWEDMVAKIRSVELYHCKITMSTETLVKFFKKFTLVTIGDGSIMDTANITDELFVELARVGTTLHYKGYINKVVAVTDATLDTLSNRNIPSKLYLKGLITGITFTRVKKMIEDVLKTGMTEVNYNCGILKNEYYNAVNSFVSEEFERWAERFDLLLAFNYEDESWNYESYTIYIDDASSYIEFAVKKPEEFLQNDNDGEVESRDESGDRL